jgi:hypothetical protein
MQSPPCEVRKTPRDVAASAGRRRPEAAILMAEENDQLSFKIPRSLKAELKKLADADRRALSPYVVLAVEKHVAEEKAKAKRK